VTIQLDPRTIERLERLVAEGRFPSIEAAIEAAVDAFLDDDVHGREAIARKVRAALSDPAPSIPLDEAMALLRRRRAV